MATDAEYRAATIQMMSECAADAGVGLQTYRGRPATLHPPTGFVDQMRTDLTPFPATSRLYQHNRRIEVLMLWGLFDSGDAVDQRDAWITAFHTWVRTRIDAVDGASLIGPLSYADDPAFIPDWLPPEKQLMYFATRVVLEGFATD